MYNRTIKVYQGIDNPVQVIVRNQDQKSIDLTGTTMQAQIQDPTNQVTINTYPVTWVDITKGQGNFVLDETTLGSLQNRFYKLTFSVTNTTTDSTIPVYVDDNYGVPLELEILPAYYAQQASVPATDYTVIDGGSI